MERERASQRNKSSLSFFCLVAADNNARASFLFQPFFSLSLLHPRLSPTPPPPQSDAPLDVQKDLKYAQAASLDEEGRPSSELAAEAAEAAAASAQAGGGEGLGGEGGAAAAAAAEHEGGVEAATGRAPAQRVGDRRVAGPAHHHNDNRGGGGALGGGGGGGGELGEGELSKKAFRAHSDEVQRAHGGGAASKHSPLASKQPPVVDVGMQNKQAREKGEERRSKKRRRSACFVLSLNTNEKNSSLFPSFPKT